MKDEALKLALVALESERPYLGPMPSKTVKAITAIKQALAAPVQEPVAWKPIETAPMNGEKFWGYGRGRQGVAFLIPRDDCEMWEFCGWSADSFAYPEVKPTHWMPLPPAPEAAPPAAQPAPVQLTENWFVRDLREYAQRFHSAHLFPGWDVQRALKHLGGCTTPPAAEFTCSTGLCHYKAVPDAIHHTDLSEHPEYISGWNDYRKAMMEMMK